VPIAVHHAHAHAHAFVEAESSLSSSSSPARCFTSTPKPRNRAQHPSRSIIRPASTARTPSSTRRGHLPTEPTTFEIHIHRDIRLNTPSHVDACTGPSVTYQFSATVCILYSLGRGCASPRVYGTNYHRHPCLGILYAWYNSTTNARDRPQQMYLRLLQGSPGASRCSRPLILTCPRAYKSPHAHSLTSPYPHIHTSSPRLSRTCFILVLRHWTPQASASSHPARRLRCSALRPELPPPICASLLHQA
jgi:hypothetical protein